MIRTTLDEIRAKLWNLPVKNPIQMEGFRFLPDIRKLVRTEYDEIKEEIGEMLQNRIKEITGRYKINLGSFWGGEDD